MLINNQVQTKDQINPAVTQKIKGQDVASLDKTLLQSVSQTDAVTNVANNPYSAVINSYSQLKDAYRAYVEAAFEGNATPDLWQNIVALSVVFHDALKGYVGHEPVGYGTIWKVVYADVLNDMGYPPSQGMLNQWDYDKDGEIGVNDLIYKSEHIGEQL